MKMMNNKSGFCPKPCFVYSIALTLHFIKHLKSMFLFYIFSESITYNTPPYILVVGMIAQDPKMGPQIFYSNRFNFRDQICLHYLPVLLYNVLYTVLLYNF